MKICVIGASGLLGGATCAALRTDGHEVHGISRPEFDLRQHDLASSLPADCEAVVLAAGAPGNSDPASLFEEDVSGAMRVAAFFAAQPQIRRAVYCSSGAVYGHRAAPSDEGTPLAPAGNYAMSRVVAENVFRAQFGARFTAARLFFPYGPGQRPQRLVSRLITAVRAGNPIRLQGVAGTPVINPVFVADAAAILAAATYDNAAPDIVNICGPDHVSIRELALAIGDLCGTVPLFEVGPDVDGNMLGASCTHLMARTALTAGLRLTLASMAGDVSS